MFFSVQKRARDGSSEHLKLYMKEMELRKRNEKKDKSNREEVIFVRLEPIPAIVWVDALSQLD